MRAILNMNIFAQGIIIVIILMFIAAVVFSFLIKKSYKNHINDIRDKDNREKRIFEYRFMNDVIDNFNEALNQNIDQVNTLAIIEKNMNFHFKTVNLGERFLKRVVSLMIILGLLGTFYGLIISINELITLLATTDQSVALGDITSGLISSIKGMSVAFITSMFGIAASILTSVISILFGLNDDRESLIVHIEEYLDNKLMISSNGLGAVDEHGNTALSLSFDRFNEALTNNLKNVAEDITKQIAGAAEDMVTTTKLIDQSVGKFDESLNNFSDNVRDFTEFNHHLKSNIQRLSISFDNFKQQMDTETQKVEHLNHLLEPLINKDKR